MYKLQLEGVLEMGSRSYIIAPHLRMKIEESNGSEKIEFYADHNIMN